MEGGGADEVVEIGGGGGGGDPGEYAAMLKRKLDMFCAAVAKSMDAKSQESSSANPNSQASDTSQLGSQASFNGDGPSRGLTSHAMQNTSVEGKLANSRSSREQSDDEDDLEGELETGNADPANAKRMRRMLSNRESARRSRRRKQAHLNDIETQVSRLRVENASLLKRLTDVTQKYNEASIDNRILKADVETMKAKVKMAEDIVRRVTGTSLLFSTVSDMSTNSMPFSSCVSDAASDAAVPIEVDMSRFFQTSLEDDGIKAQLPNAATPAVGGDMTGPASMKRVASLEHLQKRICGESSHCEPAAALWDPEIPANDKQDKLERLHWNYL